MKRAASALPNADKANKPRKVEVIRTTYKPSCIRQSLGSSVKLAWKKAIQADTERMGTIVWLGSRAFLHYLTTNVATGNTMLPCVLRWQDLCQASLLAGEAEAAFRRDSGQSSD